jgi:hypothetical protein
MHRGASRELVWHWMLEASALLASVRLRMRLRLRRAHWVQRQVKWLMLVGLQWEPPHGSASLSHIWKV